MECNKSKKRCQWVTDDPLYIQYHDLEWGVPLHDDTKLFDERYDGWKILFSSIDGNDEEEATTRLLQQMATDAGFNTSFEYLENVHFDEEGIFDADENQYEYWFKLYPWEDIAIDEDGETIYLLSDKKIYAFAFTP